MIFIAGPFQSKEEAERAKSRSKYPKCRLVVEPSVDETSWVLRLVYVRHVAYDERYFSGGVPV
jgi:hypothetical protein